MLEAYCSDRFPLNGVYNISIERSWKRASFWCKIQLLIPKIEDIGGLQNFPPGGLACLEVWRFLGAWHVLRFSRFNDLRDLRNMTSLMSLSKMVTWVARIWIKWLRTCRNYRSSIMWVMATPHVILVLLCLQDTSIKLGLAFLIAIYIHVVIIRKFWIFLVMWTLSFLLPWGGQKHKTHHWLVISTNFMIPIGKKILSQALGCPSIKMSIER